MVSRSAPMPLPRSGRRNRNRRSATTTPTVSDCRSTWRPRRCACALNTSSTLAPACRARPGARRCRSPLAPRHRPRTLPGEVAYAIKVPVGASIDARPPPTLAEASLERVVAAGIEDHQVDPALGHRHLVDHRVDVDPPSRRTVCSGRDLGVDRHQIIVPAHLQAVAGVVEQADRILAELVGELADGALHRLLVPSSTAITSKRAS